MTLIQSELPAHGHALSASDDAAELQAPGPDRSLARANPGQAYTSSSPDAVMHPLALGIAGGGLPHDNMAPALVVTYIIALQGVFPARP